MAVNALKEKAQTALSAIQSKRNHFQVPIKIWFKIFDDVIHCRMIVRDALPPIMQYIKLNKEHLLKMFNSVISDSKEINELSK